MEAILKLTEPIHLHTIIILFFFHPSVLFSLTFLFKITPICVNDILATFAISCWFYLYCKGLKQVILFLGLLSLGICLLIYLIILNRILKLLLPPHTYFVALLSPAFNCYQCTVFEFDYICDNSIMYASDQWGIKIGNYT